MDRTPQGSFKDCCSAGQLFILLNQRFSNYLYYTWIPSVRTSKSGDCWIFEADFYFYFSPVKTYS